MAVSVTHTAKVRQKNVLLAIRLWIFARLAHLALRVRLAFLDILSILTINAKDVPF